VLFNAKINLGIESGTNHVDISVVTPSFNMLGYLQRCCASVSDQERVRHEHIIMDGGSTDQTIEWLRSHQSLISEARQDDGMYDAVNKGFLIARGQIVSHLNCDEQYLPGTLDFVATYFREHRDVDVLFGDVLTVRPDGGLVAYRKGYRPIEPVILSSPLHVYTAAMFLRRRVIEGDRLYDIQYKDIGDAEFILRLLRAGYRIEHVRRYMATFTITGHNRSAYVETIPDEIRRFRRQAPWWVRRFRPAWRSVGYGMKLMTGAYSEKKPICYSIYASSDAASRTDFVAHNASFRWRF
jgi:glycosyltransferase involved in cell wall biosynthesis